MTDEQIEKIERATERLCAAEVEFNHVSILSLHGLKPDEVVALRTRYNVAKAKLIYAKNELNKLMPQEISL